MKLSGCTSKFCQRVEMFGKKITYFSGDEYQHKKLNATPAAINSVPTIFHCLKNCSFEISCFSINYQQMTATCQLLEENVYTNASLMVNSSDWTHVSVFVRDLCGFLLILVYYMLSNYFNESTDACIGESCYRRVYIVNTTQQF